jgi:amino acid transporter
MIVALALLPCARMQNGPGPHLHRVLGRWDLVLLFVVAVTNLNIVPVVAAAGPPTLLLWVLALVLFFLPQGVAVIELSERYPGEGGVYLWTKREMGELHGFLSGWCYWTNNLFYVPTVLFYLVGISVYAIGPKALPLAESRGYTLGVSLGLLWLMTVLNVRGLGVGKWVNNLGGIGTGIAALALIGLGLASAKPGAASLMMHAASLDWRFLSSFGVICFALVGLELGSVMGDEIRDPRRTLPGAVLIGGLVSGGLYLGATLAVLLALPKQEIGVVQGILQAATAMAESAGVAWIVAPLALVLTISVAGIASAWFAGSARIPFVAGVDRFLPPALGRLHPAHGTPHVALGVAAVLCSLVIAMSFLGATVKEAFVTLLDLAVVLQLVPFVYLYLILLRDGPGGAAATPFFPKWSLRASGIAGLATTGFGMVVAFVPSRQIDSVWVFEAKILIGLVICLGVAALLYRRGARAAAPSETA